MEKKINHTALTAETTPTNHLSRTCPIHDFLTVNNSHPMPVCVEQGDGACCAFLMLRFVAYCTDPEAFALKARVVIESNHIAPINNAFYTCPILNYLSEEVSNIPPCCVGRGACCAFLMLRFIAYYDNPDSFARKAKELIEKYR